MKLYVTWEGVTQSPVDGYRQRVYPNLEIDPLLQLEYC